MTYFLARTWGQTPLKSILEAPCLFHQSSQKIILVFEKKISLTAQEIPPIATMTYFLLGQNRSWLL